MADQRPDWHTYFLDIAHAVAERTDCRRAKAGALLVDREHRIVGSGYPGTAPGEPGCLAGACPRGLKDYTEIPPLSAYDDCISQHAEANAIVFTDRNLYRNGTIYITREPCFWCMKLIKNAGLAYAVFPKAPVEKTYLLAGDKMITSITDSREVIDLDRWRAHA